MQIVRLDLNHVNFYCPVTGSVICNEAEGFSDASPALKAHINNLEPTEPLFVATELVKQWDDYLAAVDEADEFVEVAEFLSSIDEPKWLAFEISFVGIPGDTSWIVIDMDYSDE